MRPGMIIILNGTSSSGKTTIAQELQAIMEPLYLHTGIDHFITRIHDKFHVSSTEARPADN